MKQTNNLCINLYICMYNLLLLFKILFFYTSENENTELYKNGGRSAMKRGRSAMLQTFYADLTQNSKNITMA